MDNFLDRFTFQKVQVLNYIYNERRNFSSNELAQKMDLSERTILKILSGLSNDLQQFKEFASIKEIKNNQFKLDCNDFFSITVVERYYLQNSLLYKVLNEIFHNKLDNLNIFIQDNFTSLGSMYRQINKIKPLLKQFQLKYLSQESITLVGSEKQFRYFYFLFYWNSCWGEVWPFTFISRDEIIKVMKEINLELPDSGLYWIAVCLTRVKMGFYIEDNPLYSSYKEDHFYYDKFSRKLNLLFKKFTNLTNEEIEKEILFTFTFLECQYQYEKNENAISLMMNFAHHNNQELFVQATLYWMKKFLGYFPIELNIDEYGVLFVNLLNIHYYAINFSGPASLFKEDFYKKRLDMHDTSQIEVMNQFYDFLVEGEEVIIYYEIFKRREFLIGRYHKLLKNSIDIINKYKIKIKIYSKINDISYLFTQVKRVFLYVELCTNDEDAELIITDRLYLRITKEKQDIFVWNSSPKREDYLRLAKRLHEIYFNKKKHPNQLIIKTLLSEICNM